MACLRFLLTSTLLLSLCLLDNTAIAREAAVVGGGDGHLAARQNEAAEWQVLHSTDAIPTPAELRTSAAGVIRVDFADAALFLGRDARVRLDANERMVTVTRGTIRLLVDSQTRSNWRTVCGSETVTCQPGSELVVTLSERLEIDVLDGTVRLFRDQQEVGTATGPAADVTAESGTDIKDPQNWISDLRDSTTPRESHGLGQLLADDPQSGGRVRLDIVRFHANVVLHAPVALVQIDQSFFNPHSRQEEGTFIFSLPPGASVSRFAMYVTHDQLIEGELVERGRADQIYTSIVSRKRDPAILEQIGDNLFKMRVFPIFARDTKRILLDFTVPLVAVDGQYRFELPLMSSLKPIDQFLLTGTIYPPFSLPTILSPTHRDLKFIQQPNGTATFRSELKEVEPPHSLVLKYAAPADRKPSRRSYRLNEEEHYVITIPGSMQPGKLEATGPTDVLLLVDTSENTKDLRQPLVVAQMIAAGLRPDDRMRVGCIDSSYRSLTDKWYGPDSPQLRASVQKLGEQFSLGLAYLNSSVTEAMRAFDDDQPLRRRLVIYVGSGELDIEAAKPFWTTPPFTSGQQTPAVIGIKTHGQSRDDWLSSAVSHSNGQSFDISGAEAFEDLFAWTLSGMSLPPRVDSVRLAGEDAELLHDTVWPRGRDLLLYSCHKHVKGNDNTASWAEGGEITVGNHTLKFAIATGAPSSEDDLFVGRMWAQQRLRKLFSQLAPTGDAFAKEKAEILTLCQRWSLMSPLTAFLVLETEEDYVRWKIDRQVRQRYWKPGGAIAPEGLPVASGKQTDIPNQRRSKRRQLDADESKMVRQVMASATAALQKNQADTAMVLLATVQARVTPNEKDDFQNLFERVQQKLRPEVSLTSLNIWRPVVDRRAHHWIPPVSSLILQLAQRDLTPDFLERQPHARELVRTVYDPPVELTMEEFVKYVNQLTKVPVLFDRQALQDEGVVVNGRLDLSGLNGISTRAMIREALQPLGLTMVAERHLLRLTTQAKADKLLTTEVYPVADLIQSQPLPSANKLANPYLDLDEAARRKIENNLKRPITAEYHDMPLDEVLQNIALRSQLNLRLDVQACQDEGIASDQQVTLNLHNVPTRTALMGILDPLGLTAISENEILKVTTLSKAEEKRQTRVFCAIGLMEEGDQASNIHLGGLNPERAGWASSLHGMGGLGGGFFGGEPTPQIPALVASTPESLPAVDDARPQPMLPAITNRAPEEKNEDLVPASNEPSQHLLPAMIAEATRGNWLDLDLEGGAANYFPLSQSIMVWHTQETQEELTRLFARLRHEFKGIPPWKPFRSSSPDFRSLTDLIRGSTSAKWIDIDQEGGSISTNAASKSLVVRQSAQVHEEILRILTQLRRARYVAESVPYRQTLEGIDEMSLFDLPMLTQLPRQNAMVKPNVNVLELKLLATARLPQRLSQHWRSVSAATGQTRDATIRRDAVRLEVLLADRTLRAEGTRAAIAYPGLALVEIDQWGEAVRQIADAALPWMPHRTNEELAEVFDISPVEEDTRAITLRFGFQGMSDTYLEGTFSKLTRQPTRWAAVAGGQRQFDLEIDLRQAIAFDTQRNELERWTLVADEAPAKIVGLADGWEMMVVVDANEFNSMYQQVRQAIQRSEFGSACALMGTRRTSAKVPGFKLFSDKAPPQQLLPSNKPLLHFLLAWSIENDTSTESKTEVSQHLKTVAKSGAVDLLRLMTPTNFPSLGNQGISTILESIPAERRSAEMCDQLTEYALGANNLDAALGHLAHALTMKADPQSIQRRRLLQVELLLRAGQADEARKLVKALGLAELSLDQICAVADLFARAGDLPFADALYAQGGRRERTLPTQLAHLIYRQASWYPQGRQRWEALIAAANLLPVSSSERRTYFQMVLDEADQPADAALLGEFAAAQKDREFQTELLLQQAELDEDVDHAAAIALQVAESRSLSEQDFGRVITIVAEAKRHDAIVQVIEARLRSRLPLENESKRQLILSYTALGKLSAARRAASEAPLARPAPMRQFNFF